MKPTRHISRSFIEKLIQDETLIFDLDVTRDSSIAVGVRDLLDIIERVYIKGQQEGYEVGVEDGKEVGYDEGYYEAEKDNFEDSYDEGYDDGYNAGYKEGVDSTTEKFRAAELERNGDKFLL